MATAKRIFAAPIEEGEHTLVFRKSEESKSKAGNAMVILTHTPVTGEPVILDHIVYSTVPGWAKLESFLNAMDVTVDDAFDLDDLGELLGCEFKATVIKDVFQGIARPKILFYGSRPAGGEEPPATSTAASPAPLAPILPKDEQEKRRAALAGRTEIWSAQRAEMEHRQEMKEELDKVNQDEQLQGNHDGSVEAHKADSNKTAVSLLARLKSQRS